jgi:predicted ArsR family transcriptional regulator
MKVLVALSYRGPMTARQIAELLDRSPNQTATRLGELHEDGFVTYALDRFGNIATRETTNGNTGRVHKITALGETMIERTGRPANPYLHLLRPEVAS